MEVNPEKQNINTLFSTTNYHIDFYQREYKWKDREVQQLISDIFYHFDYSYAEHLDLDPTEAALSRAESPGVNVEAGEPSAAWLPRLQRRSLPWRRSQKITEPSEKHRRAYRFANDIRRRNP